MLNLSSASLYADDLAREDVDFDLDLLSLGIMPLDLPYISVAIELTHVHHPLIAGHLDGLLGRYPRLLLASGRLTGWDGRRLLRECRAAANGDRRSEERRVGKEWR